MLPSHLPGLVLLHSWFRVQGANANSLGFRIGIRGKYLRAWEYCAAMVNGRHQGYNTMPRGHFTLVPQRVHAADN